MGKGEMSDRVTDGVHPGTHERDIELLMPMTSVYGCFIQLIIICKDVKTVFRNSICTTISDRSKVPFSF